MSPVVIDCDTGRDDALALWLAINSKLPLMAVVTSYGNTPLENVTRNTFDVLSFAGRSDIPVIVGEAMPIKSHRLYRDVVLTRQKASGNGLCNIKFSENLETAVFPNKCEPIADVLLSLAREYGPIDYLIMGPATNFSIAVKALGHKLQDTIATVTMMGGKFDPMWHKTPGPDFNVASDPYAVSEILEMGIQPRFLPLNSTWPIALTLDEIENLEAQTAISEIAKELMIAHCQHFAPEPVFRFHDPSLILTLQNRHHFVPKRLKIVLDESSTDFGRLIEDKDGAACHVYEVSNQVTNSHKKCILNGLGLSKPSGKRA